MVSIIMAAGDEARERAKSAGFREFSVLLRFEGCMSTKEEKARLQTELATEIKPYQFLVSDYWGMGPD